MSENRLGCPRTLGTVHSVHINVVAQIMLVVFRQHHCNNGCFSAHESCGLYRFVVRSRFTFYFTRIQVHFIEPTLLLPSNAAGLPNSTLSISDMHTRDCDVLRCIVKILQYVCNVFLNLISPSIYCSL